jgi:hypothetical protein
MKRLRFVSLLVFGLVMGFSLVAAPPAQAQRCAQLHAPDYAPVVDKGCGNWILQRMDQVDPRFGPAGWQLDDHGKRYILVGNYNRSSGSINREYFELVDRALLIDNADLRVGKARPLREDRVDRDLEENALGLYLEQGYAESIGMLPR